MRLGLDIGTNSIGWWLYRLENGHPVAVIDGGVRIFSDGRVAKTGASLAVARRDARAARRRRDRYLRRRTVLMQRLAEAGLMPQDPVAAKELERLDPYALRSLGLDEKLPLTHLGRALFHLNQRRGFKSNRKTDGGDNEAGKIKDATKRLDWAMAEAIKDEDKRTYGAFLHQRRQKLTEKAASEKKINKDGTRNDYRQTKPVRTRLTIAARDHAEKEESGYDFYPDRAHLEEEFNKLWAAQAPHHPELSDELHDSLFKNIFYQRPLKPPKVGLCLFTKERRLPKAHPLAQRRVLYQMVNELRITTDGSTSKPLDEETRNNAISFLDSKNAKNGKPKVTLKTLGTKLKLRQGERFTLETVARDTIAPDPVRASLTRVDRFGPSWSKLDDKEQWRVVRRIRNVQSDECVEVVVAWLMSRHNLSEANAKAVIDAPLPEGYSRLGMTATRNILDHLKAEVMIYSEAVKACGWLHSNERTGEVLDALPYYGEILERHVIPGSYDENDDDITRYGRITNPTVHIGLNQLRRLVNKITEVYGKPDQIVVELARELKQSEKQKKDAQKTIKLNTEAAIKRSEKLATLGQPNTGANRMRLRLWEDLNKDDCLRRFCPYTGKTISPAMVFDGSCDVDHILPYSRTLDDSFSNRTLCLREANREKRNKTPYEAWGGDAARWATITANLKNLPDNKSRRFAPDAMERFEGERGFEARALVDTQYLSRIARQYLDALYTEGGHVWVVPGRLTEMLRRHWGLNSLLSNHNRGAGKAKNRQDHRHHAIDAAVIAATDRGLVQKIAKLTEDHVEQNREAFAASVPPPWEGFRDDMKARLNQITVSHRADHGRIDPAARKAGRDSTTGQLHNDTAYGLTDEIKGNVPLVVTRKPIDSLTPAMIDKIRDPFLQTSLLFATQDKSGKDFEAAIKAFAAKEGPYQGIRRVRIIEPLDVIPIHDKTGQTTKGYKGDSNHCYEIWQLPNGKYKAQVITTFEAHQNTPPRRPHPAAKRVARIFKRDMVALDHPVFGALVCYVQVLSEANGLYLVPHRESNADARNRDKDDSFKFIQMSANPLMKAGFRHIHVNEIGQIRDAGPHDKR